MRKLFLVAPLFAVAASSLFAGDISGTYTGSFSKPDGEDTAYIVLKQVGAKISGSAGPNAQEQYPFEDGTLDGSKLDFILDVGTDSITFALKLDGDSLQGDATMLKEGEKQTAKVNAKRVAPTP